ncbi:hypothetical protein [uncultured Roseobacter sp.]|uniref:hypothetical protein n=1 Tax=uncultured Roseobacter sp. TaxID=114847 RepID=UPI00260D6AD1|nr:hypothetical protein [uncultured Roseobacter sp.]
MRRFVRLFFLCFSFSGTVGNAESEGNVDPGIIWFEALRQEGVSEVNLGVLFGVDPGILSPAKPLPLPDDGPIPVSPFKIGPYQMMVIEGGTNEIPVGPLPLPPGPIPAPPFYPGPAMDFLLSAEQEVLLDIIAKSSAETSYGIAFAVRDRIGMASDLEWVTDLARTNGLDHAGLSMSKAQQILLVEDWDSSSLTETETLKVAPRSGVDLSSMEFNDILSRESEMLFSAPMR